MDLYGKMRWDDKTRGRKEGGRHGKAHPFWKLLQYTKVVKHAICHCHLKRRRGGERALFALLILLLLFKVVMWWYGGILWCKVLNAWLVSSVIIMSFQSKKKVQESSCSLRFFAPNSFLLFSYLTFIHPATKHLSFEETTIATLKKTCIHTPPL